MEKTLAEQIREKNESIYKVAAAKFGVSYKYAWLIAKEKRLGSRCKGKLVKEYIKEQIKNK